ncbi:Aste57867_2586 [Aphanomyces stellatus]|uniref:Aste57867_2586 protein n=1 Tax=Aphanomyces stellatus TaxID=120398 RepID=A0A485K900_9STRA|nr:hypothetical protein As57867_002579 [Aphanomyces stellatus]VFT79782.1 Aste57867_2586 [Aphanomyces stellatus]
MATLVALQKHIAVHIAARCPSKRGPTCVPQTNERLDIVRSSKARLSRDVLLVVAVNILWQWWYPGVRVAIPTFAKSGTIVFAIFLRRLDGTVSVGVWAVRHPILFPSHLFHFQNIRLPGMYLTSHMSPLAIMSAETPRSSSPLVPPFLASLRAILDAANSSTIGWCFGGKAFAIYDSDALEATVLPTYFRHRKVASFQRQLNYFGFRKVQTTSTYRDGPQPDDQFQAEGPSPACVYHSPDFLQHDPARMSLIKRKTYRPKSSSPHRPPSSYTYALASSIPSHNYERSVDISMWNMHSPLSTSSSTSTNSTDHDDLDMAVDMERRFVHWGDEYEPIPFDYSVKGGCGSSLLLGDGDRDASLAFLANIL